MTTEVAILLVPARKLAVVRRQVRLNQIATAWRPALDQVWAFVRQNPDLRTDGHNVFLYHHPEKRDSPMNIDFGVEVTRPFDRSGEVFFTETPAGNVAAALHVGPYDKLGETHNAIHAWASANKVTFAGKSLEIYGDWTDDVTKLETQVQYLLT